MDINKSLELQLHAKDRIPGLCQLLSKRPDQFSWGVWPGYFSKAKGAKVWDLDGNEYLDMSISGIGATVLGYADEDVDNPVKWAIDNGVASSLNCPEEVELADLLCELHPWAQMCRFTRTGGESMMVAIRIARAYTGKDKIAFCGYHGWHDWYLAANIGTENALGEHLLSGLSPCGVPSSLQGTAFPFRYNKISELEEIVSKHGKELGVIVMEPIRNRPPEDGFLNKVRALADECGAVLIIDEISAGFRLNPGGAHLLFDLTPDIAVFSKAIGNGYSISAVIGKSNVMQAAQKSFISSTNWTERVGFTAAIATIKKYIAVKAHEHLIALGEHVQDVWARIANKNNIDIEISGIAPLSHFSYKAFDPYVAKAYMIQEMLEYGVLSSTIFYPMYSHSNNDMKIYEEALNKVFAKIQKFNNELELKLKGKKSAAGFARIS